MKSVILMKGRGLGVFDFFSVCGGGGSASGGGWLVGCFSPRRSIYLPH